MKGEDFVSNGHFNANRFKVATVTGADKPYKPPKTIDAENLETCLNCDKPKCKGYCEKIKRSNK